MAAKTKTPEEVDDHCCTVCLEEFKCPRLLPCSHTYCESCLEGILEKSSSKSSLICPQCRSLHQVPPGGPKAFIMDLLIAQDLETKKWRKKMMTSRSVCGVCEHTGEPPKSYCPQCEAFLCSYCAGAHKRMKVFSSHEIVPGYKYVEHKPSLEPISCSLHPLQIVSFYCNTCNQLICNECVAKNDITYSAEDLFSYRRVSSNHGGHTLYTLTVENVKTMEDQLDSVVKKAKSSKHTVQNDLLKLQEIESSHQAHTQDLKKALSDSMESYIKVLRLKYKEELSNIDEKSAKVTEAIQGHKKALSKKMAEFNSGLRFAQKAKECDDNVHKIAMMGQAMTMASLKTSTTQRKGFSALLSKNTQRTQAPSLSELCGPPTVVKNLENELKTGLLQKYKGGDMQIKIMPRGVMTEIFGFGAVPDSIHLGQKSKLSVTFSVQPVGQPNFKIIYGGSNFSSELPLTSELKAGSSDREKSWVISITPRCIGTHKVHVQIYGRWITTIAPTFDVTGELNENDLVQRTPNSTSTAADLFEDGQDEDLSDYEIGKLTKVERSYLGKGCTTNYKVEVTWGHDTKEPKVEELSFIWSEYSGFPLELALPTEAS